MKAVPIVLLAALLAALSAPPVLATTWREQRITGPEAWASTPAVWGDTIYWIDSRNYFSNLEYDEIRAWDPSGGERVVSHIPRGSMMESLYEDTLVYQKQIPGGHDLCIWNPVSGERTISTVSNPWYGAADIWGDTVVWEDRRSGVPQIYMWDPVNGERPVSPSNYAQTNPSIHGSTITWDDARYNTDYHHRDLAVVAWDATNGERVLGRGYDPAVWQDRFVFWYADYDDDEDTIAGPSSGLYEWTPQSGRRRLADISQLPGDEGLQIWDDLVVFSGIGVCCIDESGQVTQVNQTYFSNPVYSVSAYQNSIVWAVDGDVYLATPVPEPSSLIAMGAGLLCLFRRRRTR